jgi:hypothetical protein
MAIIASCGHTIGELDHLRQISIKAWDCGSEGWVKAVYHSSVCESCYQEYEAEGDILYTEQEELDWLKGD